MIVPLDGAAAWRGTVEPAMRSATKIVTVFVIEMILCIFFVGRAGLFA